MDIFDCVQREVERIVKEKYMNDECPPIFIVSQYYEPSNEEEDSVHQILLTVTHCGYSFSKPIFPVLENKSGYEPLEETMKYMYNRTM